MVKLGAFVALEASLSQRLTDAYSALTDSLFREVHQAIDEKDFAKAETLVQSFSLAPLYAQEQEYIKLITNMAMLFGASRVTPRVATTVVGLGGEQGIKDTVLQWFEQMVGYRAETYLKGLAMQLIAEAKAEHGPETIQKDALRSRVRSYLVKLGVAKADPVRIAQPFQSFMDSAGKSYFNMVSSLHTSRVSAYGFTAEAQALGVTQYQINEQLDNRICPVCEVMHRRVFSVSDARDLLDVATRTSDPDQLKAMMPWPKQDPDSVDELAHMSDEEIIARGWHTPPYHPHCRGLLVRVGKAPSLEDVQEATQEEPPYEASGDDFSMLGVDASDDTVKGWNNVLGLAPAAVVAGLRGMSTDEYLTGVMTGDIEPGIADLSYRDNAIGLTLDSKAFDSINNVFQDYTITSTGITVGSIALSDDDAQVARGAMRALYMLANDKGLSEIKLVAGLDTGGWAWAKYGFVPTDGSWGPLKAHLKDKMAEIDMTDDERTAVTALLSSTDPESIWTLADMPVGEKLLFDTEWVGKLDLNDPEAVSRFLAYVGE